MLPLGRDEGMAKTMKLLDVGGVVWGLLGGSIPC